MRFVFEQVPVGGDSNLSYIVGDREAGVAAIIDPSFSPDAVIERVHAQDMTVSHIINTHGHHDHINGNAEAKRLTQAPVVAYPGSIDRDLTIADNETLDIGAYRLRFLFTPGHCDDHVVIVIDEFAVAITGDVLFVGKVGRTWSDSGARQEWDSLQRLLRELPDHTTVWPGHHYGCRPSSTIGIERRVNPFFQCEDVEAFLKFKEAWPDFRPAHGLK